MTAVPHQSNKARFPGITLAARDLGVGRQHLHRVLTGERASDGLLARWQEWLTTRPEFSRLHYRKH